MRIYTRTGDEGETGLFGGERVSKDSARVEAYGTLDELNALLGVARLELDGQDDLTGLLAKIQAQLFEVGSDLATPEGQGQRRSTRSISRLSSEAVAELESAIDRLDATLPPLRTFILPGGGRAGAMLHLARTVCRRAERRVVTLAQLEVINRETLAYLNRLSDLLFVMARAANVRDGRLEIAWIPPKPS